MNEVRDLLIGIRILPETSEVAVYDRRERDAVSLPVRAGTDLTVFPTALARAVAKDAWYIGIEEAYYTGRSEAVPVRNLFALFNGTEPAPVDGVMMEPWEVLAIYLRELLGLTGVANVLSNIRGLMITTRDLGSVFAKNANRALTSLLGSDGNFSVQDEDESFFYYSLSRGPEMIRYTSALLRITERGAQLRLLVPDRSLVPVEAAVRAEDPISLDGDAAANDAALLRYVTARIPDRNVRMVYITGTVFTKERYPMTTAFLIRDGRRVFAGDNLYVKGAVYAALDKTEGKRGSGVIYRGAHRLRCSLGIDVIRDGAVSYVPLVSEGRNWFESSAQIEVIPGDAAGLTFVLSAGEGERVRKINLELPGLPERPEGAVRLSVSAECTSAESVRVTVRDLGFGGLYPASDMEWQLSVPLHPSEIVHSTGSTFPEARLCKGYKTQTPFPIESISAQILSLEELCFFLEKYPELIDGELICPALCDWIEEELHLPKLANVMREALAGGKDLSAFILPIFRTAGYRTEGELAEYRKTLAQLLQDSVLVRMKKKGDALAGYGKYADALRSYAKALAAADERQEDPVFVASLYHNMGAVYMRLLLYEESLDSFKKAYIRFHTREALRTYLCAAKIARPRSRYEEILRMMHVDDALRDEVEQAIEEAIKADIPEETGTPEEILSQLKAEYRNSSGMP